MNGKLAPSTAAVNSKCKLKVFFFKAFCCLPALLAVADADADRLINSSNLLHAQQATTMMAMGRTVN